ncbi:MAG: 3-oxoacyl-[acyl-carrier-protein] reductase [Anaerolineae bacterium]|jgi:3-oxoacyl-[acyl-carrier protein] reductase|nr:3-oxoacyl-[acyl-carrier-protein] reductase [Anaerolineae bacterium]
MSQLTNKIAVVTGGSRGIGRAISIELAKRGAHVIVNFNNNQESAQAVVDEITANGGSASSLQADVSDEAQAQKLIKEATGIHGRIDILVNNAGITRDNVIMLMKPEDFDAVINTNLRSTWLCAKAAVRAMMSKRYGRIINITSVSGIMGQSGQTNYSASKAGIIGFTKALAREVASRGITVNAVAPGFVLTDLTKDLPAELTAQLNNFIPLGRWGEAGDVANAVAFLASDEASYITGHVLNVDGGMAM